MKLIIGLFFAVLGWLGAFALPVQAQTKVKMTIPVVAHSMTPVYVAQSKGFFSAEKLDLDITSTGGGGPDSAAFCDKESAGIFSRRYKWVKPNWR